MKNHVVLESLLESRIIYCNIFTVEMHLEMYLERKILLCYRDVSSESPERTERYLELLASC